MKEEGPDNSGPFLLRVVEFSGVGAHRHAARSGAADPLVLPEELSASAEVERAAPAGVAPNSEPAAEALAATGAEEQAWIAVERAVAAQGEAAPCCGPVAARVFAGPEELALFPAGPWSFPDAEVAAPDVFQAQGEARWLYSLAASGPDG